MNQKDAKKTSENQEGHANNIPQILKLWRRQDFKTKRNRPLEEVPPAP